MKIIGLTSIALLLAVPVMGAEKKLWAKSFLNQKAPPLVVEKWLSKEPARNDKFVLIDFWATWCGPCRKAIPELNAFHRKFGDKLVVIGLSDESAETVANFTKPKIEYYSAVDTKKRLKNEVKVTGIPHLMLIDPKGIVRWEGFPFLEGDPLTEQVIKDVLAKYGPSGPGQ